MANNNNELTLHYRGRKLPFTVDEAVQMIDSLEVALSNMKSGKVALRVIEGGEGSEHFTTTQGDGLADC